MNGLEHPRNGRTAYHFQPAKFWQNGRRATVPQRHVPLLLPVQSPRRHLGRRHALMGPLRLRRPRELGRRRQCARPHLPVRRQRLLVGLRHRPPRRPPGHPLHRHRRQQGAGPECGLRQEPRRPAPPRVGEARLQPGHAHAGGRHRQQLPRPHGGVARPRRPVEGRRRRRGRRRGLPARVPERGLPPLGAQRRASARQLAGRARAGVPGPVPHGAARRGGGARRVGERRRGAARAEAHGLRQGGPLHGRAVRRRRGHLRVGGARARRRPRELAPAGPRPPVRVQVLLRRPQEAARAVGVGGRERRRRRGQGLGGHPGVPEGDLAGRRREAAGAVADRGDRDAEEEAGGPAVGDGGGGRRQEGGRRHRELAGGRAGGVRDPEPGGGRDARPQVAAGSQGAGRRDGRVRARRSRAVRAAGLGLRRPGGAHRRLLQGVQARWQVQGPHVHRSDKIVEEGGDKEAILRRISGRGRGEGEEHLAEDLDRSHGGGELRRRREGVHDGPGVPGARGDGQQPAVRVQLRRRGREGVQAGGVGAGDGGRERRRPFLARLRRTSRRMKLWL
uniref:Uncharacterized protein n=1 Tax=Triticum urartu TaxID=4572 RepID=A0A8R7TMH9_TRIUA